MKLPPLLLSFLLASASAALADETAVKPQIDSVGLFKNGLCVVKCSFTADRAGDFAWEEPPRVVHGTFLVESEAAATIRSTMRKVDASDAALPTGNLQVDLAGAEVKLTLKADETMPGGTMIGKVWTMPEGKPKPRVWISAEAAPDGYARNRYTGGLTPEPVATTGGFLVLEGDKGARDYIALGRIGRVEILKPGTVHKRAEDKASIIFTVAKAGPVSVSYLTRGASWVPAYFVDLTDAKKLRIRQTAVVKNELMPLAGAELALISGYPNVEFGHVDSPLWQGGSLAAFFQQIGGKPSSRSSSLSQQTLGNSYSAANFAPLPAGDEPGATSQDLHFESIGKRTLEPGDALSLEVAAGETAYERVVEWAIADKRDAYGNYLTHGSRNDSEEPEGAWDSVIFQNPLKFPMTTASATIRQDGQFRGQSQSNWTNPGQRSCLHITKALSLQTDHTEIEESGKRENEVWIGGRRYYRTTVKAEATARNFRSAPVTLLMKAQFSGALVEAEEKPGDTLRREGVFSVNPRHELEWKLTLPSGAEKKIVYRYTVLVSS
ncbi:MAG TPA: hypothetical protein VGO11_06965 [Chthoniobacteraceae bacterium]|jgi:hypothetical protein|nr:hypothetical protein [Chthoniobacteraceae bacterium]